MYASHDNHHNSQNRERLGKESIVLNRKSNHTEITIRHPYKYKAENQVNVDKKLIQPNKN